MADIHVPVQRTGRPPMYPELQDRDWLHARYVVEGLSQERIAELIDFGCTHKTVGNWLRRHGIPARPRGVRAPATRPGWAEGQTQMPRKRGSW